jgi:HSP20 family protein
MANLVKRENHDVARPGSAGYRWDPFRVMDALLRWDPFREDYGHLTSNAVQFAPRFDVKETKDAYVLKADLPGVTEEEIEVSLSGNMLTISGKKEEEHREEGEQYYAMERSYGSFSRSFTLPDGGDGEQVTADLKNGVLTLQIPKRPEAQPKKITIGKGDDGGGKAKA